jgi:WD40 repeat protein
MVKLWDVATGHEMAGFRAARGFIGVLAFSPDGRSLATGSHATADARVWDLATGEMMHELGVHANYVAFAPDGKSLITCSVGENEAQCWEFPSGRRLGALKGHVGGMTLVTFSPDGRTLATGAYDGRIRLWNTATRQEVATLPHPGSINALRFSPDGRALAASFWVFPQIQAQLYRAPLLEEIDTAESTRHQSSP